MVNHSSFVKKLSNLYPNNTIDQMEHAALSMAVNATDENGDYIAFSFYENNGKVYLTDLGDVLFASHHEDFVKKLADKLGITFNEQSKSFELEIENLEDDYVKHQVGIMTNFVITSLKLEELLSLENVDALLDDGESEQDDLEQVFNDLLSVYSQDSLIKTENEITVCSGVFDLDGEFTFKAVKENGKVVFACEEEVYNIINKSKYKDAFLTMFYLKENAGRYEVTLSKDEGVDYAVNTLTALTTLASNLELL